VFFYYIGSTHWFKGIGDKREYFSNDSGPLIHGGHIMESCPSRSKQCRQNHIKTQKVVMAAFLGGLIALVFTAEAVSYECPGTPGTVIGTVYCDNTFTMWVNGEEVAKDPVAFTPHQAVRVAFEWDGTSSITYAIQCEDFASESGYEYTGSDRPQLGDGALIAEFNDGLGTVTAANSWRVYTATFGPTDASQQNGCSASNLSACVVEDRGMPQGWTTVDFDDSGWVLATSYSAEEAGWGRSPEWSSTEGCCNFTSPIDRTGLGCNLTMKEEECLVPRTEFAGSTAEFIWAGDLERDNRVLFRHTASCGTSESR
jgi:hypothetical protein